MIRALIIDDEKQSRNALREEINLHCPDVKILAEAESVETGIEAIDTFHPDLIFLDIQLGDGTGFDIIQKTEWKNHKTIFITAYDQYAIKAFKFSAVDYLLKPVDSAELKAAVYRATHSVPAVNSDNLQSLIHNVNLSHRKRIAIPSCNGISIFELDEIIRCQSDSNYTTIFLSNGEKLMSAKTLKEFEELLHTNNFERVHQSHLINLRHLKKYVNRDGGYLVLSDGSHIPLAQRKRHHMITLLESLQ